MTDDLVIVGAGGFGRETLDIVEAAIAAGADLRLLGVIDAQPRIADLEHLRQRDVAFLGRDEEWLTKSTGSERFIIAIGEPSIRQTVASRFDARGLQGISVVHPKAVVGSRLRIGRGVVIAAGVQVSTNVTLGDHVHLNPGCIVGHDAIFANCVSVNPGAIVSGNVRLEPQTLLGAGSVVLQGLTIGAGATVGAAACVTKDVPPGETVVGIPARKLHVDPVRANGGALGRRK